MKNWEQSFFKTMVGSRSGDAVKKAALGSDRQRLLTAAV